MIITKAIRQVMRTRNMTLASMGSAIGKDETVKAYSEDGTSYRKSTGVRVPMTPSDVSARLNGSNLSFDKAVEMLSVLGYEVVIQEIRPGKRREDQIVIDQKEE